MHPAIGKIIIDDRIAKQRYYPDNEVTAHEIIEKLFAYYATEEFNAYAYDDDGK